MLLSQPRARAARVTHRRAAIENIVFDSEGNPVTVDNALLRACRSGTFGGRFFPCELGYGPLIGTGYEVGCEGGSREGAAASTGCLETTSTVEPGSTLVLRFTIWDSGDGGLDSLALIDGFEWIPTPFESIPP